MLSTENLTFVLAKQIVLQDDAVRTEAKIMAQALGANFVSRHGFHSKPNKSNQQHQSQHSRQQPQSQSGSSSYSAKKPNNGPTQERKWGPCHRCTKNHDYYKCPAINWKCHACHQKGHTRKCKRCPKNKNKHANVVSVFPDGEPLITSQPSASADSDRSIQDEIDRLFCVNEV